LIYGELHWFVNFIMSSGRIACVFPGNTPSLRLSGLESSQVETREKGWVPEMGSGNILREVAKLLESSSPCGEWWMMDMDA
jgi:hypothetical protein